MNGIEIKTISIPAGYTDGGTISLDNTIDDIVDTQLDLITQIRQVADNLPESSGGNTIAKVCKSLTVSANFSEYNSDDMFYPIFIIYTSIENGILAFNKAKLDLSNNYIVLNNLLCGSTVTVFSEGLYYASSSLIDEIPWEYEHTDILGGSETIASGFIDIYRIPKTAESGILIFDEYD
jgi:hypothetical protein